jgi:hypothetical protein
MGNNRFDRNIRFFGKEGQDRLAATQVAVVGVGGLGTHVVQQLALLGVGHITLIDKEEIDETNLNRYVGVHHNDPIPGTRKKDIGKRLIGEINPDIHVVDIPASLISEEAFTAIIQADYVFGCLDNEGARMILNELCTAYSKPYIDLASDIIPDESPDYGGRVCISWDGQGCIVCYGQLDVAEAHAELESPEGQQDRRAIYGIPREALDDVGPSVVSINGIIASLGVTEFMLWVTGIRLPKRLLTYHGNMGRVTASVDEPAPDCYYCKEVRGKGDAADVQRYLRAGLEL